ncbi:MAG: peptidylprolyl isomerase, partial [Nitrospirae bacterium]|nr:peptidylprolyl isomerase [Nitrospirota bacterium]
PKGGASKKAEARKKAEQIMNKLKKGQDFAELARDYSAGPTRTTGGDLGCLRTGQLDKQFESLVFALKPGKTTDVIDTEYGFHIFKATDKKAETVLAYESVKEKLRQLLLEEKAKQEADIQARKLREKADVEILVQDKASKQGIK